MQLTKINNKMKRAVADLESFMDNGEGRNRFVYRFGIFTSAEDEGVLIGLFHADTEEEIRRFIGILDMKFDYADTRADVEFDMPQDCWYGTYTISYPFGKTMEGSGSGQNARPLF